MKQVIRTIGTICMGLFVVTFDAAGQNPTKGPRDKAVVTIHIRELTEPERVVRFEIGDITSVIDAVGSLKPRPADLSRMDMWLTRPHPKNGKAQILKFDYDSITRAGSTATNFQLFPGDRLFLQARLSK